MFKKLLASVGIGSASVNLELPKTTAELGSTMNGVVKIKGGSIEQEVEQIYINLVLISHYGEGDETRSITKTVSTIKVADKMILLPGQEETLPVAIKIPWNVPITCGRTKYFLKTGLDIDDALDPTDHDDIKVVPNKYMQMLFDAIDMLGFRPKHGSGDYNGRYQEFEFRPTSFMGRELDEIEIYPSADEQAINGVMQIDKRNRGLLGVLMDDLELDERFVRFSLNYAQMVGVPQVAQTIKEIIETEYKKI